MSTAHSAAADTRHRTDTGPPDLGADRHPSRFLQERVLRDPADNDAWRGLRRSYADMSDSWRDWTSEQQDYDLAVRDGLRHTRPAPWAVEICCGTGEATGGISETVPKVFACDLNVPMLKHRAAVPDAIWFAADVQSLPLGTGTVPLVVSLNGVFSPSELVRVIRPGGQLLWCTSFRSGTPLYVPPEHIHGMLGEGWSAEGQHAGHGEWTLFTAPYGNPG